MGNPFKHGKQPIQLYRCWWDMIARCRYGHKDYGQRGITVCSEWEHDYVTFRDWAFANGWEVGLTLDRIDNDGNYCPENCRFVTRKKNCRNKRNNRFYTINGETKCLAEWCEIHTITQGLVKSRLQRGWTIEDALTTPKRPSKWD